MPIIFRVRSVAFYIYSKEHLPIHVHIRAAEKRAKIEVESGKLVYNKGFSKKDIGIILKIVKKEKNYIKEFWHEYFKNND